MIGAYLNNESELKKDKLIIDYIDFISPKIELLEITVNKNAYSEVHLKENKNLVIEYVITSMFDINVIPFASVFSNTGELIFISSILIDCASKTYPITSKHKTNIRHEISIPNLNSGEFYLSFGLADPGF